MKTCPNCARLIEDDASFCMYCGFKFSEAGLTCPSCGTSVPAEALFCPKCGCKLSKGQDMHDAEPQPVKKEVPSHRRRGNVSVKAGLYLYGDQCAPGTVYVNQDSIEWAPSLAGAMLARKTSLHYPVIRCCGLVQCGKLPVLMFEDSGGNQTGFACVGGMLEAFKFNFSRQREDLKMLALEIELHRREYLDWDYQPLGGFQDSLFDVSDYSDEELLQVFNLI